MSCDDAEMLPAAAAAARPLDVDDLLSEILLRLPPLPSSLPRASAVCKRWRSLASDPAFTRRFRLHHRRSPPLLGCFHTRPLGISFEPALEAPNRVPPGRLSLLLNSYFRLLGCRHGLALILHPPQLLVWDPVTGHQHRLAIPLQSDPTKSSTNGAVLRSAVGDVHFKVVWVVVVENAYEVLACVYSSETGVWGNIISTPIPLGVNFIHTAVCVEPAVLVGGSLYWILAGTLSKLLEFDLERESLDVIRLPAHMSDNAGCLNASDEEGRFSVMRAEGGGLGLLILSGFTVQLWKRKTDCDGVASWEMVGAVELGRLLSLHSQITIQMFAEDNNLVLLCTGSSLFTVQLETLLFKKISISRRYQDHPFESVYATGNIMPLHCWYDKTKLLFDNWLMECLLHPFM